MVSPPSFKQHFTLSIHLIFGLPYPPLFDIIFTYLSTSCSFNTSKPHTALSYLLPQINKHTFINGLKRNDNDSKFNFLN